MPHDRRYVPAMTPTLMTADDSSVETDGALDGEDVVPGFTCTLSAIL